MLVYLVGTWSNARLTIRMNERAKKDVVKRDGHSIEENKILLVSCGCL